MQPRARRSVVRPLALVVAASALIAAATAVGAAAGAAPRASSATQVLDVGMVRVHVPASWVVTVGQEVCAHGSCRRECAPGYDKRVYLSTFAPLLSCPLNFRRNALWIVPTSKKGPTTRQTLAYDGGSVIETIPSSGVVLYGFGKPGVRAVDTEAPSTLARLLATKLPTVVPARWKRVTDGALSIAVPPSWPVHRLGSDSVAPGVCGSRPFPSPAAYVGTAGAVVHCGEMTLSTAAEADTPPGNGAWLAPAGSDNRQSAGMTLRGPGAKELRIGGRAVTVVYSRAPNGSNTLRASTIVDGRRHVLILGLGLTPPVAASILSSLRPA